MVFFIRCKYNGWQETTTIMKLFMLLVLAGLTTVVTTFEPISSLIGGLAFASGFYGMWEYKIKCQFEECCSSPYWIQHNVTKFEMLFDSHVFGQHIVKDIVSKVLRSHLRKTSPKKALVMIFHGWTGSGKNYVAKFIAKSLFRAGLQSKYVHTFISTVDFPEEQKVDIYKLKVQRLIEETVKQCAQSMFIFDEVDKMPDGLVDAIKAYIDYHEDVLGIDFRRTIFIFLSNTGGKIINDLSFDFWKNGRVREEITYNELEQYVIRGAFNEIGGLHHSAVIDKHLVDRYVPFLPMERRHVALCIVAEVAERNTTIDLKPEDIDSILDELVFEPKGYFVYASNGCKTISAKVDFVLEDLIEKGRL